MAQITINDKLTVNGKLTFNNTMNQDKTGFIIDGVLLTHLYFDDIQKIETNRFILNNVEVYRESFGSDDYNIGYSFTAEKAIIKGDEYEGAKYILYPSEMKEIEEIMYKDEHPILGDIGKEYKDIIKKEEE